MLQHSYSALLLAWLSSYINFSNSRLSLVLSTYGSLEEALSDNFAKLKNQKLPWLDKFFELTPSLELEELKKQLNEMQIGLICILDENYPAALKFLSNPPVLLYFQGNLELLKSPSLVTIVGSRNVATYTKQILPKILTPVIQKETVVVSGLALGVDAFAHTLAVENNGRTIAVIGSGLDDQSFYPQENLRLKHSILDSGGLVLSEYKPKTKPTIYNFPARNRILAGLSKLTWVVQAGQKSGSLITSKVAFEIGKVVATTPASILDVGFSGNIELLQQGASIITKSEDILDILGLVYHNLERVEKSVEFTSENEKKVYSSLSFSPKNIDKIIENTNLDFVQVQTVLTILEIRQMVLNLGENNWVKK